MNRGGFSWKRLIGLSAAKAKLSRQIGIPLTRSGRERKIGRMITGGGCLLPMCSFLAFFVLIIKLLTSM